MMGSQATLPGIDVDAPATTITRVGAIDADRPARGRPGDEEPGRDEWVIHLKSRHRLLPGWPSVPAAQQVLTELEWTARTNAYAYPSNRRLSEGTGLSPRMVQIALRLLEQLGWIRAVFAGPGGRQRRGFVMLRRIAVNTPAAETAEAVARIEAFLKRRKYGEVLTEDLDQQAERTPQPLRSGGDNPLRSRKRKDDHQKKEEARTKTKSKPASPAGGLALDEVQNRKADPTPPIEAEPVAPSRPAPAAQVEAAPAAAPTPTAEALEVAAWAKGHRPELERFALDWSRDVPPAWVRAVIEGKIVGRDKLPNNPIAYLGKILAAWKRAGTCEAIPGSTLANPTGARAAVEYHRVDPARRRPPITREEVDRNLAQLNSSDRVPSREKRRHAPAAAQL